MLVYVDDVIITGTSSVEVEKVISQLGSAFSLNDLGTLSYFLVLKRLEVKKAYCLHKRNTLLVCSARPR